MKTITCLSIYLLLFSVIFLTGFSNRRPEAVTAIVDVNLLSMHKQGLLTHQTVLIENGLITKIGLTEKTKIPAKAKIINGTGKYLLPGFFDMHAHFFYEQGENVNTCEAELKLMLANGLTTVRIECGDKVYLETRKKIETGEFRGPRIFVASPQFVGNWPWPGKVFAEICKTPQEAELAVKKCKAEGYDEIKITFMVKPEVYEAIIKTAQEVGLKVTGHVGPLVKLPAALAAKQQIEHMDEFIDCLLPDTSYNHGQSVSDMNIWRKKAWATVPFLEEKKIPALVKSVKAADIYVTPTNFFFFSCFADSNNMEHFMNRPDFDFIPKKIKEERRQIRNRYWNSAPPAESRKRYVDLRKKMTLALAEAGVKLMAGSDSPEWFNVQGFSIHDEMETMASCGLDPYSVLETATTHPASYLGLISTKGTIETGKDADLILLEKNPLQSIANTRSICGVMQGGTWYSKDELAELLQEAKTVLGR